MTAVLTMDIQELNTQFVEDLKHQFAHSDVEIRVHERPNAASAFTLNDFWHIIEKLDWSKEGDDDAVVEIHCNSAGSSVSPLPCTWQGRGCPKGG